LAVGTGEHGPRLDGFAVQVREGSEEFVSRARERAFPNKICRRGVSPGPDPSLPECVPMRLGGCSARPLPPSNRSPSFQEAQNGESQSGGRRRLARKPPDLSSTASRAITTGRAFPAAHRAVLVLADFFRKHGSGRRATDYGESRRVTPGREHPASSRSSRGTRSGCAGGRCQAMAPARCRRSARRPPARGWPGRQRSAPNPIEVARAPSAPGALRYGRKARPPGIRTLPGVIEFLCYQPVSPVNLGQMLRPRRFR